MIKIDNTNDPIDPYDFTVLDCHDCRKMLGFFDSHLKKQVTILCEDCFIKRPKINQDESDGT